MRIEKKIKKAGNYHEPETNSEDQKKKNSEKEKKVEQLNSTPK